MLRLDPAVGLAEFGLARASAMESTNKNDKEGTSKLSLNSLELPASSVFISASPMCSTAAPGWLGAYALIDTSAIARDNDVRSEGTTDSKTLKRSLICFFTSKRAYIPPAEFSRTDPRPKSTANQDEHGT
jgi:hypothetical protein